MWWILFAVLAHAGNAGVFIFDKGLLGTKTFVGHPLKYAALSGTLAGSAGSLLLITPQLPGWWLVEWSFLSGFLWIAGLWFFYRALQASDASRIVPLAGSLVPLFTWVLAVSWLGEQLNSRIFLGIIALLTGGALLTISWRGTRKINLSTIWLILVSSMAFAGYYVITKRIYNETTFLTAFAYSRLGVGLIGFILLLFLLLSRPKKKEICAKHPSRRYPATAVGAVAASKLLGAGALLLQHYAINLGSVTVVNALQGWQFIVVLLLAATVSKRWPKLYSEELSRTAWWQKIAGIALVSLGLILVTWQLF